MTTKYDRLIEDRFGNPVFMKIGDHAGESLVGVRDISYGVKPCSNCNELSIDGQCGCHAEATCEGCGMPTDMCDCDSADVCPACGTMPTNVDAACTCGLTEGKAMRCNECGMKESTCQCGMKESKKKKGPTKKAAQKILRGTKTFKDKMKKVSGWAEDPAAAAAWMTHKATGKWPSEK